jgi:hypothetical protein
VGEPQYPTTRRHPKGDQNEAEAAHCDHLAAVLQERPKGKAGGLGGMFIPHLTHSGVAWAMIREEELKAHRGS